MCAPVFRLTWLTDIHHSQCPQNPLAELQTTTHRYHDDGFVGLTGGSSYIETFHGSRPIDAGYMDWRSVRTRQLEAERLARQASSAESLAVKDLAHHNRALGEEVSRLTRMLEAQQRHFAQADDYLRSGGNGGQQNGSGGGGGGAGSSNDVRGRSGAAYEPGGSSPQPPWRYSPHGSSSGSRQQNPLESTLSAAYWNAIRLVHLHDAATAGLGAQQQRSYLEARAALYDASVQRVAEVSGWARRMGWMLPVLLE